MNPLSNDQPSQHEQLPDLSSQKIQQKPSQNKLDFEQKQVKDDDIYERDYLKISLRIFQQIMQFQITPEQSLISHADSYFNHIISIRNQYYSFYSFIQKDKLQLEFLPSKILPAVKQSYSDCFSFIRKQLNNNEQSGLHRVQNILNIKFTNLSELNLSCNNINNLETLSFLNSPVVNFINLASNQISNIKPLIKGNFKYLADIKLYNNPITRLDGLERINSIRLLWFFTKKQQNEKEFQYDDSRLAFKYENFCREWSGYYWQGCQEDNEELNKKSNGRIHHKILDREFVQTKMGQDTSDPQLITRLIERLEQLNRQR